MLRSNARMKKIFPLKVPGKDDKRIVELVRNEVGKYVNREKRKALPPEHDRWEFACRIGPDKPSSLPTELKSVHVAIDAVAAAGAEEVYVEIVASPGRRAKAPPLPAVAGSEATADESVL